MVFSSLVFLFTFLPAVLLIYFLVPRPAKNAALLAASLIFYAWGEPVYVFLMLLSILLNYFCGLEMAEREARGLGKQETFCVRRGSQSGTSGIF